MIKKITIGFLITKFLYKSTNIECINNKSRENPGSIIYSITLSNNAKPLSFLGLSLIVTICNPADVQTLKISPFLCAAMASSNCCSIAPRTNQPKSPPFEEEPLSALYVFAISSKVFVPALTLLIILVESESAKVFLNKDVSNKIWLT